MMTDPRAKMRALRAYHYEHNALSGREGDLVFDLSDDEAIALLPAERPSVPMAMLDELGVWMQGGSAKANEILTHHGFAVKETP